MYLFPVVPAVQPEPSEAQPSLGLHGASWTQASVKTPSWSVSHLFFADAGVEEHHAEADREEPKVGLLENWRSVF
jgi:hypothetical protein